MEAMKMTWSLVPQWLIGGRYLWNSHPLTVRPHFFFSHSQVKMCCYTCDTIKLKFYLFLLGIVLCFFVRQEFIQESGYVYQFCSVGSLGVSVLHIERFGNCRGWPRDICLFLWRGLLCLQFHQKFLASSSQTTHSLPCLFSSILHSPTVQTQLLKVSSPQLSLQLCVHGSPPLSRTSSATSME